MKCPYCKGKNLYLKRTWPQDVYGCKTCELEIKHLRECGLSETQIKKHFQLRKKGGTP